jgi:nitrate/nitrite-specific signal transduction histidine kinase
MKYSIKRKLFLGLGFQFLMVVASVSMGIAAVHLLTTDTQNILRDNYKTLEYCHAMALAIDDHEHPQQAVEDFRIHLQKQEDNITEPGEMELTKQLAAYFQEFAANPADPEVQRRIRSSLHSITKMNMEAIERKSELAQQTASSSNFMMGTVGTMSFIFAFMLLLNLPASIADPIKEFTESIQQIAKKNYAWRINDLRNDEFGAMAKSFNLMATELQAYESSNVALMMFEKKRMETLINQMHNPVIGLNNTKTILFANSAALKILNLKSEDLIGKSADSRGTPE